MRRSVTVLAAVLGFVFLIGCEQPIAEEEPAQEAAYGMEADMTAEVMPDEPPVEEPPTRIHVVAKDDTLYSLARQYYNDQAKWKDIWEANKGQIPDKDKLKPGQELVIP